MPFTPKDILDSIPEEKRLRRLDALVKIYKESIAKRWSGTYLNVGVLLHCVESYFCDVTRTKAFHEISLADQHKRAAFTMKWIAKTRPIQLVNGERITKAALLSNEVFALFAGLEHLDIKPQEISDKYTLNLLYTLHNRNLDAEVISSMMYLVEQSMTGNKP